MHLILERRQRAALNDLLLSLHYLVCIWTPDSQANLCTTVMARTAKFLIRHSGSVNCIPDFSYHSLY